VSTPRIRTDIVDVYAFRRLSRAEDSAGVGSVEFLQLRRAREPMRGTWQPVMGHVEADETSVRAAARELREETGLDVGDPRVVGFWALERVRPYFMAELDAIVLSPRFALEVRPGWEPVLDASLDAWRWVTRVEDFHWADQHDAVHEVLDRVIPGGTASRDLRSLNLPAHDGDR
jgi:8-oxo-dGTP pyrophosphatase MutT (NUDIX family)